MVKEMKDWAIRSQVLRCFPFGGSIMDAVHRLDVGGGDGNIYISSIFLKV